MARLPWSLMKLLEEEQSRDEGANRRAESVGVARADLSDCASPLQQPAFRAARELPSGRPEKDTQQVSEAIAASSACSTDRAGLTALEGGRPASARLRRRLV